MNLNDWLIPKAWFDNCIGALNLRHFMMFLCSLTLGHLYAFFRMKNNKQIILDVLGHRAYVCTIVPHLCFFFAGLGFFLVNLFFVLGDTSAVNLMNTGLKVPMDKVKALSWGKAKLAMEKRLGTSSFVSMMLSFGVPEIRIKNRLIMVFNRRFGPGVEIVEEDRA